MALDPLFGWNPGWILDPGPEVFALLNSLRGEQQAQVLKVISEAHAQVHAAKSIGYAKIAEAVDAAARGGGGGS